MLRAILELRKLCSLSNPEGIEKLRNEVMQVFEDFNRTNVAQSFLRGERTIRVGDNFLMDGVFPTRLINIGSEGKWTYFDGSHVTEPFAIPQPNQHQRLYTIAEVEDIVGIEALAATAGGTLSSSGGCFPGRPCAQWPECEKCGPPRI